MLWRSAASLIALDVHAVDLDHAGLRIERAVQQRERGRLAGAGRADQRNGFARQRREREIGDRRPLAVVGERHVGEFDQPAHAAGIDRVGAVAHRRHGIEHLEEFAQARRIHQHAVGEADHLFEADDQERGEIHEGDDLADGRDDPGCGDRCRRRKIDSIVSVVAERVSTAITAHQESTGICAASRRSTSSRRLDHLGLDAGEALHQRDIAQRVRGALGERREVALDLALQLLGLVDHQRGQRREDDAEDDQQRGEPPVDEQRERQQHEQRDERGEMLAEEREPQRPTAHRRR